MKKSVFYPGIPESSRHHPKGYRSAFAASGAFEFVEGHFPYGLHHFYRSENPRYFVMLREPVERAISNYYFIKHCSSSSYTHPLYEYVRRHSLEEFYENPAFQNAQARVVAGLVAEYAGRFLELNGLVGKLALRRAKYNLIERYEAFGLTERFRDSARLFADHIGTDVAAPDERYKETAERPTAEDLPDSTVCELRRQNALDVTLYQFAVDHFDRQLNE